MATSTLQLYWDLAALDPKERMKAAQLLIRNLVKFQLAHESTLGDARDQSIDSEESLDQLCAPDVSYAVRRLLRGLSSSRQGARQGFSLALTELLTMLDNVTAKLVLDLLFKFTERTKSMSGDEKRDLLFGRLFGIMAMVAAGMLSRSSTTNEDIDRILKGVKDAAQLKSYLREVCYHIIINMLPYITALDCKQQAMENILDLFLGDGINNADDLNLALAVLQHVPDVDLSSKCKGWKSTALLSSANLSRLSLILKEAPVDESNHVAIWKPQLHSVWDRVLMAYIDPATNESFQKHGSVAPFEEFWSVVVDESMFLLSATHGRKFWGFQIVEKVLPRLDPKQTPFIFTENFMKEFMHNLGSSERYLNKAAKHTASVILKVAEENKQVGFTLVTQLLGSNGQLQFDAITRTKTVENLISTLDIDGVKSYLEYLTKAFVEQEDVKSIWVLRQLALLVTNVKIPKDEVVLQTIVRFLLIHSFFNVNDNSKAKGPYSQGEHPRLSPVSDTLRNACRQQLQSVLIALSKMRPTNKEKSNEIIRTRRFNGVTNDGELWIYHVYHIFETLEKDTKHFTSLIHLDKESTNARKMALKSLDHLRSQNKERAYDSLERGYENLLLNLMLHLFVDEEEAYSTLLEVVACCEKTFPKKATKSKKGQTTSEDEPEPVEVMIDILVSFLTNESRVIKNLAEQVFENFSHKMTKKSLDELLNIIATSNSKDGEAELFGEDMDEDDNVEEVTSEASEDTEEDDDDDGEGESDDDDNDDNEDEDSDEDDDDDDNEDLELLNKLKKVTETQDDDEEDLPDLDDEGMAVFDEKIAEIFRQKKLEKKEKKNAEHRMVHFKNNVMDLIEIFTSRNPTNPLVLDVILPLLGMLKESNDSKSVTIQLVNKVISFLRNKLPKQSTYPQQMSDRAAEILKEVHEFAKHTPQPTWADTCCFLALYLVKCASVNDTNNATSNSTLAWVQVYRSSLEEFMSKKRHTVPAKMLSVLIERYSHLAWPLVDSLTPFIRPSACVNPFRQSLAVQWVRSIVQRCVGKKPSEEASQRFIATVPQLAAVIESTIEEALNGNAVPDYKVMKGLVEFAAAMVQTHKNVVADSQKLNQVWHANVFEQLASAPVYAERGPGVKQACQVVQRRLA